MIRTANIVAGLALKTSMKQTAMGPWRWFLKAAEQPREAQDRALQAILTANAETDFGRDHGFAGIRSAEDFRRAVPVQTYETLRPYVDRQDATGAPALTGERPRYYHRTSGTLDKPKDIPLTASAIDRIRGYQRLSAYAAWRGSKFFRGRILGIGSPAVEGHRASGAPYGSATGLIYESQPSAVRSKFVLPPDLFAVADYDARYYALALLAMATPDVSGIATANPSTLLKLRDVIRGNFDDLLGDLAAGTLRVGGRMTAAQNAAIVDRLRPDPARVRALAAQCPHDDAIDFAALWPRLAGIMTWTGGSCGYQIPALRALIPDGTKIIEVGYAASEVRGTINVDVARNLCLPTLTDHYFEFVEQAAWERGDAAFLGLHEISEGAHYYVFVTTPDGLYRYNINDIVTVTGRVADTPTLAFVQKGAGVTSITGEKLSETQTLDAVRSAWRPCAVPDFFVVLADESRAGYDMFIETATPMTARYLTSAANAMDNRLRRLNVEYDAKRASGRLDGLRVIAVAPGTADTYRRHCVARGQRDGQFKLRHLQYARDCDFDFTRHTVTAARP